MPYYSGFSDLFDIDTCWGVCAAYDRCMNTSVERLETTVISSHTSVVTSVCVDHLRWIAIFCATACTCIDIELIKFDDLSRDPFIVA